MGRFLLHNVNEFNIHTIYEALNRYLSCKKK